MKYQLHHGDCLEVLKTMADNSVDSIVTDPPYGLSFMGKKWDYDVPSEDVWRECLRVLKPGGHLLAFAGTRTQHRMAVRIEDAGFEIRDMIAWVYGSGFPKSLDVSKAIDKQDAAEAQQARRYRFTEWVRSTGLTSKQIDDATGTNMGGHYTTAASQPAIMTREHLDAVRHLVGDVPQWVERECDTRSVESENFKRREVVGKSDNGIAGGSGKHAGQEAAYGFGAEFNITAPATEAAKQWQGWGTALKPALEPITVARKPFPGTVAANVLEHGTGALNVDGCRVGTNGETPKGSGKPCPNGNADMMSRAIGKAGGNVTPDAGRWPANLIHDGSEEVVGLFPVTTSGSGKPRVEKTGDSTKSKTGGLGIEGGRPVGFETAQYTDTGSAARFFYCAKTSKKDRDEGCEGLEEKAYQSNAGPKEGSIEKYGYEEAAQRMKEKCVSRNHHPTVKPTDLMRYLCRLVTPPSGIVLDPFMGSGSTGKAALLEGFRFIGIERDEEYMKIAEARIKAQKCD
jgi:DNA modification methylase